MHVVPVQAGVALLSFRALFAVGHPAGVAEVGRFGVEDVPVFTLVALGGVGAEDAVGTAAEADSGVEVGALFAFGAGVAVVGAGEAVGVSVFAGDAVGPVPVVALGALFAEGGARVSGCTGEALGDDCLAEVAEGFVDVEPVVGDALALLVLVGGLDEVALRTAEVALARGGVGADLAADDVGAGLDGGEAGGEGQGEEGEAEQ